MFGLDDAWPERSSLDDAAKLWDPFICLLPVTGASVTMVSAAGARLSLGSNDATAARIDELQSELGEGPQWVAARTGQVVIVSDVVADAHDEWPVLGAALRELPVGALFSVPIQMGAVTLGVVTLYCSAPRKLTPDQQITALAIGSAIAGPASYQAMRVSAEETETDSTTALALDREIHQATGVILVQLNTTATIAYARLQAYAFANGRTVKAVAHEIVTGQLSFRDSTG